MSSGSEKEKPAEAYIVFTCPYCGRTVSIENIQIVIHVHVQVPQQVQPEVTATAKPTETPQAVKQKLVDSKKVVFRSLERRFGSDRAASLLTVLSFRDEGSTYRVEITSSLDPEYYKYIAWLLTKKLGGEKLDDRGRVFRIPKQVPVPTSRSKSGT
ncbi:MAG: hypothetical protein DRJ40_05960 [Thermoprotei archaeon]|nr:MAG: hypothetical protein DRJ40_05960 [Thermoprotei archaeon]